MNIVEKLKDYHLTDSGMKKDKLLKNVFGELGHDRPPDSSYGI